MKYRAPGERPAASITDERLAVLVARVETGLADLYAYLAEAGRLPPRIDGVYLWPDLPSHPDLVTPPKAAREAGVSAQTIRRWAQRHGIGKVYGRRMLISRVMLQPLIAPNCK